MDVRHKAKRCYEVNHAAGIRTSSPEVFDTWIAGVSKSTCVGGPNGVWVVGLNGKFGSWPLGCLAEQNLSWWAERHSGCL